MLRLGTMRSELLRSADDLLGLGEASSSTLEVNIASELSHVAGDCTHFLDDVIDLLSILDAMSTKADRDVIRNYLNLKTPYFVKLFDHCIGRVNNGLARTSKPAIENAGGQLRDQLRKARELLNSMSAK